LTGGVRKEFFQLLVAQLFSPDFGMFSKTPDGRSLWINQHNPNLGFDVDLNQFNLIGVLLGLAMYNGVLLDLHMPKLFFKKLLMRTVGNKTSLHRLFVPIFLLRFSTLT
jgi:ubiquitin-protein ligase E3 A